MGWPTSSPCVLGHIADRAAEAQKPGCSCWIVWVATSFMSDKSAGGAVIGVHALSPSMKNTMPLGNTKSRKARLAAFQIGSGMIQGCEQGVRDADSAPG